jgi:hypothetical protein
MAIEKEAYDRGFDEGYIKALKDFDLGFHRGVEQTNLENKREIDRLRNIIAENILRNSDEPNLVLGRVEWPPVNAYGRHPGPYVLRNMGKFNDS